MRRGFDILCAALGLALLSPLFAAIAVAIKVQDGGPVLFIHRRVGRKSRGFGLLKFRSMVPRADLIGGPVTVARDPRVTPLGAFLRKHKLDELPQVLNVLKGDMQLVGPRPECECYVNRFASEYASLLRDRPGITDPASLAFRDEEQVLEANNAEEQYVSNILPRKLALSRAYAAHRTLMTDLDVVLRTVFGRPLTEDTARRRQLHRQA